MSRRFPFTLLALALAAAPAYAGKSQDVGVDHSEHCQHHQHHGADRNHAGTAPSDNARWTPDAPLREGMRRMRGALERLSHHDSGQLDDARVHELATAVDEAVAFMFANCKLEPEPDHALHAILAQFMAGAQALHANPSDPSPVASMRAALEDYARQFDDPTSLAPGNAER